MCLLLVRTSIWIAINKRLCFEREEKEQIRYDYKGDIIPAASKFKVFALGTSYSLTYMIRILLKIMAAYYVSP